MGDRALSRLPGYAFVGTPNLSSRRGQPVVATIIHYTASGGDAEGDISWLVSPASKASAHFVIGRDGVVTQLADLGMATWHAGASQLLVGTERLRGVNERTIGIELDNCGLLHRGRSGAFFWEAGSRMMRYAGREPERASLRLPSGECVDGWWEPYAQEQIGALLDLLSALRFAGHTTAAANCLGHNEVCVPAGRKLDPGPLFPWERLPRLSAPTCQRV